MGAEYFVVYVLSPPGLLFIAATIAIPFVMWRLILGKDFINVGFKPLAAGYAAALFAHAIASFIESWFNFLGQTIDGITFTSVFWKTIFSWTILIYLMFVIYMLILVGTIGVPLAAVLIKKQRLNRCSIALSLIIIWLFHSLITSQYFTYPMQQYGRFKLFADHLKALLIWVIGIGGAFLYAIFLSIRRIKQTQSNFS